MEHKTFWNRMDPCHCYLAKIVQVFYLRAAKNRAAQPDNTTVELIFIGRLTIAVCLSWVYYVDFLHKCDWAHLVPSNNDHLAISLALSKSRDMDTCFQTYSHTVWNGNAPKMAGFLWYEWHWLPLHEHYVCCQTITCPQTQKCNNYILSFLVNKKERKIHTSQTVIWCSLSFCFPLPVTPHLKCKRKIQKRKKNSTSVSAPVLVFVMIWMHPGVLCAAPDISPALFSQSHLDQGAAILI